MNKVLQGGLFGLYRGVKATGLLNTRWGRRVFESAYHLYKERFEAGPIGMLRPWVRPNSVVLDIGANVGFFTLRFASWVQGPCGKVLALEPEAVNFAGLQRAVARAGVGARVEAIQAAAAATTGTGLLELNPRHPGDHKLSAQGVPVTLTTVDDLLRDRGWPEVSFIKIDVQGAEAQVLAGARETLARFQPALFLEVEDAKLRNYGSGARELLTACTAQGYAIHTRVGKELSPALDVDEATARAEKEAYTDFLLIASNPQQAGARAE